MRYYTSIFLLFIAGFVGAQDFQSKIYNSYLLEQMDTWKEVIEQMSNRYETTGDMALLYEIAEVEYGYIAYCLSVKRKKEAEVLLDIADEHIDLLLEWQSDNPRIYSLKGACYGLRIRLKPLKVVQLGRKSAEANQKAIELGPKEPQAWMEKANIAFYKPAFAGGSKSEAVLLYEKAVELYEALPDRTLKNWLYLNCLVGLGLAYEKTDQIQAAGAVYEKLLKMEPSFRWVSEDLYPQFKEKHSLN